MHNPLADMPFRLSERAAAVSRPLATGFAGLVIAVLAAAVAGVCAVWLTPAALSEGIRVANRLISEQLTAEIRRLDREVERLCRERYPETRFLRQVKGVGPITALAFVLTLEDPQRFAHSRSVGSYLGLRPRQRDSGEQRPQLRITKAGDALLRRLLVTAAHYILGPFGPDTALRRHGLRIAERGGNAAKKRAVVAVARKLAVLLHRLWVSGELYQPLGYDASLAKAA